MKPTFGILRLFAGLCLLSVVALFALASYSLPKIARPLSIRMRERDSRPIPQREIGFWIWSGAKYSKLQSPAQSLDVIFIELAEVQTEAIQFRLGGKSEALHGTFLQPNFPRLPSNLPSVPRYFAVFRFAPAVDLSIVSITDLIRTYETEKIRSRRAGRNFIGIQIDYDCPTDALRAYASFLSKFRQQLKAGEQLSITALLDWFRPGTDISSVLQNVDEFVPQFYDVLSPSNHQPLQIAQKVDAGRWAAGFNSFGVPYRLGIATFGRLLAAGGDAQIHTISDLNMLELAVDPNLKRVAVTSNAAGEQVVRYRQEPNSRWRWRIAPVDYFEMILATPVSVREAYVESENFGGYCAGILFFRWPASNESLTLTMKEVAWATGALPFPGTYLTALDGDCSTVHCLDLFLHPANRYSPDWQQFRIASSIPLEYFLPDEHAPVKVVGTRNIEVTLPPFAGVPAIYLGRAVAVARAEFRLVSGN
jgi:hypothetical protein